MTVATAVAKAQPSARPLTEYCEVTKGVTTICWLLDPLLHVKLDAPDTTSVAVFPKQNASEFTEIFKESMTNTVPFEAATQPCWEVPATVYTLVVVGLSVTLDAFVALLQV